MNVIKSVLVPDKGVPPVKFVVVNLTVSVETVVKLSLPTAPLVTVTTAPTTVAEKSAWASIVFFKFVAVVLLFVWTWNSNAPGEPRVEVNTTDVPLFLVKVIVLPAVIFA